MSLKAEQLLFVLFSLYTTFLQSAPPVFANHYYKPCLSVSRRDMLTKAAADVLQPEDLTGARLPQLT